jgi:hypothetical protein
VRPPLHEAGGVDNALAAAKPAQALDHGRAAG